MSQKSVLVVAAHPDDEILGVGATLAKHSVNGDKVTVVIMAEGATSRDAQRDVDGRDDELSALQESCKEALSALGVSDVSFLGFADNRMDSVAFLDVVKPLEKIIAQVKPDTVYCHHAGDLNIDHQISHRAVLTACRPIPGTHVPKEILAFETVSSTEWAAASPSQDFKPNYFVDVSDFMKQKMEALRCYESEMRPYPHARSYESVEALSKTRGASCGFEAAEAFMIVRRLWG